MKILALCALVSLLAVTVPVARAQTPTPDPMRYSVSYDIKTRHVTPIVGVKVGAMPRLFGSPKLSAEVWTFTGFDTQSQRAIAGFGRGFAVSGRY